MNTTPISPYVVETDRLTKLFGERTVVRDVELRVPRGTAFGYLGPNGAGKTTLIRMLLGLTSASSGSMKVRGLPVPAQRAEALSRVGAIVEEPKFHGHLTGRENLEVVAAARGREAFARIDGALGMRQRLGIARCLLADPELLILDEPMNGLDPGGIQDFRGFVRSFVDEGGTIVLSSHLLDEIEKTCDHVAIVDQGRVVVQGSIDELRGGQDPQLLLGVDDSPRARALLTAHSAVLRVVDDGHELRVALRDGDAIPDLNRRLVESGIAVHRLESAQATLEQRFLEITTRLENAA
jgi:ABC-2 type transport system ATP-binding protein